MTLRSGLRPRSVFGGALDVIDDEEFAGAFRGDELQPKLLLDGGEDRGECGVAYIAGAAGCAAASSSATAE